MTAAGSLPLFFQFSMCTNILHYFPYSYSYAVQTKITYIVEYREPPGHDWQRLASDVEDTKFKVTKFTRKKDYYYRLIYYNDAL